MSCVPAFRDAPYKRGDKMDTQYIVICEKKAEKQAKEYFLESCQVRASKAGTEKLRTAGMALLEQIRKKVQIKCAYVSTDQFDLHGNILELSSIRLKCNVIEQFEKAKIHKIYLYVVTSGEYRMDTEKLSEAFYADSWGTAFVQSARDLMKETIQEQNPNNFVLQSFGPGYFGMPLEEISKFFLLINCNPIGVTYNESGLMIPVKSLAGINVVLKEPVKIDINDCRSCIGDKSGCEFCSTKIKMRR